MVAFQINSFLRSRPRASLFLNRFARTQAVEFLAEWSLTPTNLAFLRVQTGMMDPSQVGDKSKWFAHTLTPMRFSVWDDGSSLNGALRSLKQFENPTDESGSDSEGAESTSSSYSSLSDFVSEMVSSDLSPSLQEIYGGTTHHHHVINQSISLVDPKLVYRPPSKLQYPEGFEEVTRIDEDPERPDSAASSSSSRSDLSSPSFNRDSEFEFNPRTRSETQTTRNTTIEKEDIGSFESENSSSITTTKTTIHKDGETKKRVPAPISPNFAKQPSVGNVLARTSSSGSSSSHPSLGSANSQRQSSQSSLFEQFASQAKELVKETTRQSSQDGLLAHVDKVNYVMLNN